MYFRVDDQSYISYILISIIFRITDFQIQIKNPKQPYGSATLNLTWTAPGDDFTFGRAFQYKIYCGYERLRYVIEFNLLI